MPKVGDIIRAEDFKTNGGFIGQIIEFPSNLIPANTLLCDRAELSREAYPELFAVINTIYGEGDGSTTFNIPDYRGAFLRCTGGNADVLGVLQGDAIRNITGSFAVRSYRADNITQITDSPLGAFNQDVYTNIGSTNYTALGSGRAKTELWTFTASNVVPTAEENRPINHSVNICIIYE